MADQDGGILQKILSVTAPPNPNLSSKQRRTKPRATLPSARQTGIDNKPYCEACGDGGELLCCERCPSSFHFVCCDPPFDSLHLPEGEWVCQGCRPPPAHIEEYPNTIFRPLLTQCCSENPLVFSLPEDMMNMVAIKDFKQERRVKTDQSSVKFCYTCNRSSRFGRMISCDFCPLSFHMDCLTPPLPDKPILSSWMCPNHAEHKISGLQDARLTNRIKALEKCRTDISRQAIKMDFLDTLNKIPHYQRNTVRTNRRASEVPAAIKAMYYEPLVDSLKTPCLTELLVTAAEQLEALRREGEKERRSIGRGMSPSPITTSEEQDKWTRHAVLSQLKKHPVHNSSYDQTHNFVDNEHNCSSTVEDLKNILGINDLSKWTVTSSGEESTCNGVSTDQEEMEVERKCNGMSSKSWAETCPSSNNNLMNGLLEDTPTDPSNDLIPDVSQLDDGMIRLLAEQRMKQLFHERKCKLESSPHDSHVTISKHLNGVINKQLYSNRKSHREAVPIPPPPYPFGILCPVSSYGPAHHLYKRIITIGASSNMDVCLRDYGHCNFISSHHACLILDKDASEHELINYSEHGSIVDGVLYSCDFSEKSSTSDSNNPPLLLLDDISARGSGIRAEKARKRLEAARKCLEDKTKAGKALTAALRLSKSVAKDYVPPDTSILLTGTKRRRSNDDTPSEPNSPASSIVSIPLSKTKKNSSQHRSPDKSNDKKKHSLPEKKPLTEQSGITPVRPPLDRHVDSKPCLCKRSASSLIGSGGKGWEGAATVAHGSKLRFGCIQVVLSISNRPGHNELLQALKQHNLL